MSKISVLLTDAEDARFTAYCNDRGFKKSTLIARLIREHLDREAFATQPQLFETPTRTKGREVPPRSRGQ